MDRMVTDHDVYQESRAVAEKPHDAVVKFDTYRNLQRHRAVLPAIARLSCFVCRITFYRNRSVVVV